MHFDVVYYQTILIRIFSMDCDWRDNVIFKSLKYTFANKMSINSNFFLQTFYRKFAKKFELIIISQRNIQIQKRNA